jgi:aquaporin Z
MAETTTTTAAVTTNAQKFSAEVLGTFVLVFFGVGTALATGADVVTTGLAFGLTVMVMAYSVGRVSGGHFNPAVTVGAAAGGRLAWSQVPAYVGAQLLGAILASTVLWVIWQGIPGFSSDGSFGQNSFGDAGGIGFAWWAALLVEIVATFIFLTAILAVTDERNEHPGLAPLAIGLSLAMIHFATIPLTGTSVNPARSIGPALFAGSDAIIQLWLFILAPLLGGALAGVVYPLLFGRQGEPVAGSGLRFTRRTPPGAVPGYGAPDAYQQQWNQQFPAQAPPPGQPWPQQQWQQPPYPTEPQPGQPPQGAPGQQPGSGSGDDGQTQVRPPT